MSALTLIPLGLMGEYASELNLNQDQYLSYMAQSARRKQRKIIAKQCLSKKEQKVASAKLETKWAPHFVPMKYIQEKSSPFFQFNVGVGFLYFSDIKSNLGGAPTLNFQSPLPNFDNVPFRGTIQYNRTPLYEALIGYRLLPWFKFALSYQHQGGVNISTEALIPTNDSSGRARLVADLNLDAIMAKVYFELPFALVIKNLATTPYLATGVGAGWQSWTQVQAQYLDVSPLFRNRYLALNDKTSANAVWMVDVGLRLQDAIRRQKFSVVIGCKYNQWGQARNIGGLDDQGQLPLGLNHPFSIKTVYSFAPYLGAQWNFPPSCYVPVPPTFVNGRSADSWVPFWTKANQFADPGIWTQFNVGVGFLYFENVKGILVANGPTATPTIGSPTEFGPLRGGFSYNRTPLFEYIVGWRIRPWLRAGISAQSQGQVSVQSNWQTAVAATTGVDEEHFYRLSANLNLNSIMLRVFYDSHWSMIWKNINFAPFVGAGIGPGWQSWVNLTIQDMLISTGNGRNNNPCFLKQKTSANAVWLIDAGLKMKSLLPNINFSVIAGLKFNYWGQARNIGLLSQQGGNKQFLQRPLCIKNVYSFAPYLGVNMNFPVNRYSGKNFFMIGENTPNTWRAFFTPSRNIQIKRSVWTQFNMGVGFLYFSGASMTLDGIPASDFNFETTSSTDTGKLQYNKTPLYEYLLGYRFNNWLKAALSYQHQGGVFVQTEPQDGQLPTFTSNSLTKATFRSSLELDAILAKGYLELPFAMIFKGTATSPYLGLGVGVGWQTWDAKVQHIQYDEGFINYITQQPLQSKICANAVWMIDAGMHIRSAYPGGLFSVNLGCKYNQWGQARNIGQLDQQGALTTGISGPFRVKMVYQFAPYVGVQWDF